MSGDMSIKTNKCSSSYPAARSPEEDQCVWSTYSPLLPPLILARLQPQLCVLVSGSALDYKAESRHGLLPDGQASWYGQFLFLICTTFLAVPFQTPHSRKVGLPGPACAPVGWLGVSSMGLCLRLPWDGA